jgi:hypothetical protein
LPVASQSAQSTALIASSMKPPVCPRSRIASYIRCQSTSTSVGSAPSTSGASRRLTIVAATSGPTGACASPTPTIPASVVSRTIVVSRLSENRQR